jgi:hypothetical protein
MRRVIQQFPSTAMLTHFTRRSTAFVPLFFVIERQPLSRLRGLFDGHALIAS